MQNLRKGRIYGLNKIGTKKIPEHVRCHKQTELERAKATLLLATLPKSLPCRTKYVKLEFLVPSFFLYFLGTLVSYGGHGLLCREMEEITAFIKGAICNDQCLGRCLYIHGVPGTGKVCWP